MKKNITPLVALRKLRPGRKALVLIIYFLMISLMIAFVVWRGMSAPRLELPPVTETEVVATESEPLTMPVELSFHTSEEFAPLETLTEDTAVEPVKPAPTEPMRWPADGEILFGHHEVYRINSQVRLHVGVDIAVPPDALVAAIWPGVVSDVREDSRYGLMLEIDHGGGYVSLYANLADVFFSVGEEVKGGEVVALAGESAGLDASEGLFLHFALYHDGKAVDPIREIESR